MTRWILIGTTAALSTFGTLGLGARLTAGGRTWDDAQARRVAVEFFHSQNVRQYDRTCALFSRGFYAKNRLPDRATCVALLRVGFMWSGQIDYRIGAVEHDGDHVVVRATADRAPGRIVLVSERGRLKILSVRGG